MNDMDKLARERISNETGTNFFVEAGAGSGKTTQLVNRMASMVKAGIDVRKICAITFTKAAALEFYKRFQKELARTAKKTDDELIRQRCTDALQNIDLCFMGTIDSFSHLILHEHPIEGRIPSSSAVVDDSRISAVYQREYSNILHGEYGDELLEKFRLFSKVQREPMKTFTLFFKEIIDSRSSDIIYDAPPEGSIDELFAKEKAAFMQAVDCIVAHKEKWSENKGQQPGNEAVETLHKRYRGTWDNDFDGVFKAFGQLTKFRLMCHPSEVGILKESLFCPYESKGKIQYYVFDFENFDLYRELMEYQYSATMDFLVSAAGKVAEKLRRTGELTYFDYALYLRDMLRRDTVSGGKLIRHIYDRHSFYLVDEFQDTDPMQAEILFFLTAEEPVSDWRKCRPKAGSLFIVGDPKQSIYRFRSADVAAFKEVRRLFEEGAGEVLELTRNFRSTNTLKSSFNEMFRTLLPEGTADQSRFSAIPIEEQKGGQFTGVWYYNTQMKGQSVVDEDIDVANIIHSLVGREEYLIADKDTKELRPLRYSDFMLLTMSKFHIAQFASTFTQLGIPSRVEGSAEFAECPALKAMSEIMAAVGSPDSETAVYAALTGQVFCIPDSELLRLKEMSIWLKLSNGDRIKENGSEELCLAVNKLKSLVSASYSLSPSALFSKAMDELRIADRCGADSLEYLYFALELLRNAETAGEVMSVSDGAAFISQLLGGNDTERCLSLQRDENKVHIANLHKVKGLEAPVVILAHPYKRHFDPDRRNEHRPEGDTVRFFRLSGRDNEITITSAETKKFPAAFELEKASADAETLRLLYVAATRARNVLLISHGVKSNGDTANNNPWEPLLPFAEGSFYECVMPGKPQFADRNETVAAAGLYDKGEENVLADRSAEEATYTLSLPSQIKLNDVVKNDSAENETEVRDSGYNAALAGTMVHKLMECIVSANTLPPADELITGIMNSFEAEDGYGSLLRGVYDRMTAGGFPQTNGMPDDILAELRGAEEVCCEVPFCRKVTDGDSTAIWHGVIDLLYRKDGCWRIVDYKTNAEAVGLDDKYKGQLDAYKEAFRAVTGEEADAFIYHIDV